MYVCQRCHYDSNQKGHMLRHLNKRTACPPTYSQETRENLIEHLNVQHHDEQLQTHDCNCGASYKYASGLSRHKKTCTYVEPVIADTQALAQRVAELEARLADVANKPPQNVVNNITYNTTNNTTNNTSVFVRNNFGFEKVSHITADDNFMQSCLLNRDVCNLIENIYCDKEHPENHTVRTRNVNQCIMEKFDNNTWQQIGQDALLTDLIQRGYQIMKVYARSNKEAVIENSFDDDEEDYHALMRWLQNECYNDKEMKSAKRNLVIVFRNNKTLLLGKLQ